MSTDQRIDRRIPLTYSSLSPRERKAADTLLEHLDDPATYRAAELPPLAAVSKATMCRLLAGPWGSTGVSAISATYDRLRELE